MSSFLNDTWFKQRHEYLDALDERLKPNERYVVRKLYERTMRRGEHPEDDPDLLTQVLGIPRGAWKKYRETLMLKNKITIQGGRIVVMGSEELLAEHLDSREKYRKRAAAGGYAKAAKDKKANDINERNMLEACPKHALNSAERKIDSREKEKNKTFCGVKEGVAGIPVSVDDGVQGTFGHENSRAKEMIYSLFTKFLASKTGENLEQANCAVVQLLRIAKDESRYLADIMKEAIDTDAEDPVGYVRSKVEKSLKLQQGGVPEQITLSTLDRDFKALQAFCKEKYDKTLLNVHSKTWVDKWMYEEFQAFNAEKKSQMSE